MHHHPLNLSPSSPSFIKLNCISISEQTSFFFKYLNTNKTRGGQTSLRRMDYIPPLITKVIHITPCYWNAGSLLECWQNQRVNKRLKQNWKTTPRFPLCIMWDIWLQRNKRCFEGQRLHISFVINRCLEDLYLWCSNGMIGSLSYYLDFWTYWR